MQFARRQSAPPAAGASPDDARLATRGTGELALGAPDDGPGAAELHRRSQAAAAFGQLEPPSILDLDLDHPDPPAALRCPECGTPAARHARYCSHCGAALPV